MATINTRVAKLIDKTVNSNSEFSKRTGISTVILSHIKSGRNKVSLNAVEAIITAFPNINTEWLILGKGEMFKDEVDTTQYTEIQEAVSGLENYLQEHRKYTDAQLSAIKKLIENLMV